MMSRLRLVIAWLVMAAVPLQGLAAATMVFCGPAHHEQAATRAGDTGNHKHSDGASHGQAKAEVQNDEVKSQPPVPKALPDVNHKCGICASCCYTVAIAQSVYTPAFMPLPQSELAEPVVLIHTPPSQLPDKPPRA